MSDAVFDRIEKQLPEFFDRAQAEKYTNGLVSVQSLRQLAHRRQGPKVHYFGQKVVYLKEEFMEWVRSYYAATKYRADPWGAGSDVCGDEEHPAAIGEQGEGTEGCRNATSEKDSAGDVGGRIDDQQV
jgi:hypothetical protein